MEIIAFFIGLLFAIFGFQNNGGSEAPLLTETEARQIAETSCIKGGDALSDGIYNEITKTWWFDANLNMTKPGCNPACVVDEATKTAEINWRCTGFSPLPDESPAAITNFEECAAAGNPVMESYPRQCRANGKTFVEVITSAEITCTPEQREAEACTMDYNPVCAKVKVECFKAPCDPIPETFSNSCVACQNERVISYTEGECEE